MPYVILFIFILVLLVFALVFRWLLHDNVRQSYIAGLVFFYAVCTIIRHCSGSAYFIDDLTHGWALIIYAASLVLSVWCAVSFLMNIIPNQRFRFECGVFMLTELLVLIVAAMMRYHKEHYYMQFFYIAMLVIGGMSVVMAFYYFIRCRREITLHNRILLIAAFVMLGTLIVSLILNLRGSQYVYLCGGGIIVYLGTYITVSIVRLHYIIRQLDSLEVQSDTENDQTPAEDISLSVQPDAEADPSASVLNAAFLTHRETRILDIMCDHNTVITKCILQHMPDNATENSVNITLSRLMKNAKVTNREALRAKYKQDNP